MRPGEYFDFTPFVAAPRVGIAWDINGDGKQALRASGGTFYASRRAVQRAGWETFVGVPPSQFSRQIRWATFDDVSNFATSARRSSSRRSPRLGGGETRSLESPTT
jgi:hypothetical protein